MNDPGTAESIKEMPRDLNKAGDGDVIMEADKHEEYFLDPG
jgi:hypothetical protein